MTDSKRMPVLPFHLIKFDRAHLYHMDNKFVIGLYGKFSLVYCDTRLRTEEKAISHFWRWIGAA